MRTSIALALAALLAAPAAASAQRLAVAEAAAVSQGVEKEDVARVRALFEESLQGTGVEVTPKGRKGPRPEFVASLSVAKEGADVLLTAQVSRLALDLWASRAQVRVQGATADGVTAAVQDLASRIALAVRTAPPRSVAVPAARPPARKLAVPAVAKDRAEVQPAAAPATDAEAK